MKKENYRVYRVQVDLYRPTFGKYHVYQNTCYPTTELRNRPSEGSYFVKTISKDDARRLVREKIGKFGSIDEIYDCTNMIISETVGSFKVDLTNPSQCRYMYLKDKLEPNKVITFFECVEYAKREYNLK